MSLTRVKKYLQVSACLLCLASYKSILANNDILLTGTDLQQHALSEYIGKGKWTVVNIWGVDCPPCREEMPELVLLSSHYGDRFLSVLGIAIDFPSFGYPDQEEVTKFMDEQLVDFPVLLSDETITSKLGAGPLRGLPTTFIFTPDGKLVGEQTGAINQKIIIDFITNYISGSNPEKK